MGRGGQPSRQLEGGKGGRPDSQPPQVAKESEGWGDEEEGEDRGRQHQHIPGEAQMNAVYRAPTEGNTRRDPKQGQVGKAPENAKTKNPTKEGKLQTI